MCAADLGSDDDDGNTSRRTFIDLNFGTYDWLFQYYDEL